MQSTELLEVLPSPGQWREEDYLWLTGRTRRLVELSSGNIEVLPMPTERHQAIVAAIFLVLQANLGARGGVVRFAPLRVRLDDGRFREPDLVALRSATDPRRADSYWSGADLAVEVISPDDPQRDLVTKRAEYEAAGVSEYWIVDPRNESVTVLVLTGGRYVEQGPFLGAQAFTSPTLGVSIGVDSLFAEV